jgi:hypothetical protein
MKRSRFSEEQVIAILKEQEAGMTACLISHAQKPCCSDSISVQ